MKSRYIQKYRLARRNSGLRQTADTAHCETCSCAFQSGETTMRNAVTRSNLLVPEVREVMDIRQASDYLGISPDTLYKYASEGFVPAFKLGNRWRFKRSRLDEWMDRQSEQQAAALDVDPELKKPVKPAL